MQTTPQSLRSEKYHKFLRQGLYMEAAHRMGWLAGWLGWLAGLAGLGLQEAAGSVPEDSVPFGRGPPGCGAAANN